MSDGSTATASTGAGIAGSITHSGRTLTPITSTFGTITAGGNASASTAATDAKSGPAQVGDACEIGLVAALPAGMMLPYCVITVAGTATVYFPAAVAILAGSITYNVLWRG